MNRLLLLPLLLLTALPALAQQPRNEIAASFGRADSNVLGDALAFGLAYNRFWTERFSTRFGMFAAGEEEDNGAERVFGAYHASAEVHWWRDRLVSPYAGVGIAYAVDTFELAQFGIDEEETTVTGIVSGGIDLQLARRFALSGELRLMRYDVADERAPRTNDPVVALVSGKFRF